MYAMQANDLIAKFLEERLGIDPTTVVPSALLADLGVDSLMLAELMFEAEDRLGISIDMEPNGELPRTVGDMTSLIEGLLDKKSPTP